MGMTLGGSARYGGVIGALDTERTRGGHGFASRIPL